MINIICPSRYTIAKKIIKQAATDFLVSKQQSLKSTLNIVFIGTRKMREIANTYKNEDVALPVLAFSYKDVDIEGEHLFGEVLLCYPQVVLLAAEKGKKVDDMIVKLVQHGIENIIKS